LTIALLWIFISSTYPTYGSEICFKNSLNLQLSEKLKEKLVIKLFNISEIILKFLKNVFESV
jgi:hypothetical protein